MVYCFYKSFCEPKPKDFEHSYQCCNSCNNNKCTNRCKDDCKTCGLVADKERIKQMKLKFVLGPKDILVESDKTDKIKEDENKVSLIEEKSLTSSELTKKEARKRRREARKNKK